MSQVYALKNSSKKQTLFRKCQEVRHTKLFLNPIHLGSLHSKSRVTFSSEGYKIELWKTCINSEARSDAKETSAQPALQDNHASASSNCNYVKTVVIVYIQKTPLFLTFVRF